MSKQVRVGLVGTSWWADSLLIDNILANQPVSPNFYDGFKTQQVIEAALEAQRCGCWVDVPV